MDVPFPENSADPVRVRDQRRCIASISQRATNIKTPACSRTENDAMALLTNFYSGRRLCAPPEIF
jgi:hypothetical protein